MPDPFWLGVGVTLLLVIALGNWLQQCGPEPGTVAHARELYADGEIDEVELERRLDVIMDLEAAAIREEVERVSGIGEQTSWDIAAAFDSRRDVREADRERLEQVPNVGPERARAIQEYLRE